MATAKNSGRLGTGTPFTNRTSFEGKKVVVPRVFWAVVGSGLSLRRGGSKRGRSDWRFDCPVNRAHTVTMSYASPQGGNDEARVVLCCHGEPGGHARGACHESTPCSACGCATLVVLAAMGCSYPDLYQQPAAAAGRCVAAKGRSWRSGQCRDYAYVVSGIEGPLCLAHLMDAVGLPRTVLFLGSRR